MNENELDLNLEDLDQIQANEDKKLLVKDRFAKLSEKMTLEAKGKAEAEAKVKTEADARLQAEKERDFYKDFSQVSSKYPGASEYQAQILEKVNSGYTTEDAAISILAKEGKLPVAEPPRPDNVAGGSASTVITDTGDKKIEEMSSEEKRSALLQMEKEGVNLLKL